LDVNQGTTWISAILFGILCAVLASARGRNPAGWFIVGLFLQCVGLVVLIVMPDLTKEQEKVSDLRTKNRRLREQAKADRLMAEQRHLATQERLDAHDKELKIDTSDKIAGLAPGELPPPPERPATPEERQVFERALWFYVDQEQQVGPVAFAVIKKTWRNGIIGSSTFVWREGMEDWMRMRDIPGLESELRG